MNSDSLALSRRLQREFRCDLFACPASHAATQRWIRDQQLELIIGKSANVAWLTCETRVTIADRLDVATRASTAERWNRHESVSRDMRGLECHRRRFHW